MTANSGHLLIIGGTGMLADVSLYFSNRYDTTTVIARKITRLNRLVQPKQQGKIINPISVDYADYTELEKAVSCSISQFGSFDTIISWIHSSAQEALERICKLNNIEDSETDLFEILSSETGCDPEYRARRAEIFHRYAGIKYHFITLGFIEENDTKRWLTHREICDGVIAAVENHRKSSIIGMLDVK